MCAIKNDNIKTSDLTLNLYLDLTTIITILIITKRYIAFTLSLSIYVDISQYISIRKLSYSLIYKL